MQVRLVAQVTIAAGRAEVFEYLVNLKRHPLWNPHLQTVTPQTTLKEGMTYRTTSLMLGVQIAGENTAIRLLAPAELELQNNSGAIHYRVHYQLKTEAAKTKLICTTLVSVQSKAFMFTKPVLKLLARRELQADLQALKIAVEQNLT